MYRLRHVIFKERLDWSVCSNNGMEQDRYDKLDPVYMVATDGGNIAQGCWRILPTTGDYMLKNTFPVLLHGKSAPTDSNIWELSRFAIAPVDGSDFRQMNLGAVTYEMMRELLHFANSNSISHYVTVMSVALERLLRKIGLPMTRLGNGRAVKIGKVLSIACRIPINDEFSKAVGG